MELIVNLPGLDGVWRRQSDKAETYDEKQTEARRKEEDAKLPSEAEGRPPEETVVAEPVLESEATDVGRPIRIRRPPVRFGIESM